MLDYTEYEWHDVPKLMYYSLVLGIGLYLAYAPFHFTGIPGVQVIFYAALLSIGVSVVFALLTFPAYYFDGKKIHEANGVDWDPDIKMYILTSIFLTPYVVGGVYMMRRDRNVRTLDAGKKMV